MREIQLATPEDKPVLGIPYTWGVGHNWYVRLEDGTYWISPGGFKKVAAVSDDHRVTVEDFRYASTIRFTDYTDAK